MSKFKVGDRVKAYPYGDRDNTPRVGEVIELVEPSNPTSAVRVRDFKEGNVTYWGPEALDLESAPSPVEPARPRELGDGFQCYVNLTQSPTPEQWKQSYLDVTASHGQALIEVARLRKELEAAKAGPQVVEHWKEKACGDHDATISKLRADAEERAQLQARTERAMSQLREERNGFRGQLADADSKIGRLTRELERAKRGQR